MQRVILRGVDVESARDAIGTDRYAAGTEAARRRAVIQLHWNPSEQALTGTVRDGNAGELRTVSAEFRASAGFPLRFRIGHCSCADGVNCRHVAALVVTATDESVALASAQDRAHRKSTLPWEESLDSLLAATRSPPVAGPDDAHPGGQTKLAIELSLVRQPEPRSTNGYVNGRHLPAAARGVAEPARMRLQARIVQMGRSGGWIAGNLSWSRIEYMTIRDEYPAAHVRLLHELFAIYRAGTNPYHEFGYGYSGYGHDLKHIDLAACESR
jgi:hypothetical protein